LDEEWYEEIVAVMRAAGGRAEGLRMRAFDRGVVARGIASGRRWRWPKAILTRAAARSCIIYGQTRGRPWTQPAVRAQLGRVAAGPP